MLVTKTRLARIDIVESAKYIADDNPDAARRFLVATDETIEFIKNSPTVGRLEKISGQISLRKWFVKGFPKHLIFYTVLSDEIKIIRVIHSARDYPKVLSD